MLAFALKRAEFDKMHLDSLARKKREGANDNSERGDPDFEAARDKVCNSGGECVICLAVNMEGTREGIKM